MISERRAEPYVWRALLQKIQYQRSRSYEYHAHRITMGSRRLQKKKLQEQKPTMRLLPRNSANPDRALWGARFKYLRKASGGTPYGGSIGFADTLRATSDETKARKHNTSCLKSFCRSLKTKVRRVCSTEKKTQGRTYNGGRRSDHSTVHRLRRTREAAGQPRSRPKWSPKEEQIDSSVLVVAQKT